MTRLELIAEGQTGQCLALRRFLTDNRISGKLSARVQRNAQHAICEKSQNIAETEVELLWMVSEPLRVELHFEMFSPVLITHPLFRRYCEVCTAGMQKLCHAAVHVAVLSRHDVLFSEAEEPTHPQMYFVISGMLSYLVENQLRGCLAAGQWMSEGTLWCSWVHLGTAKAQTNLRLLVVGASDCQAILRQFRGHDFNPHIYATKYVTHLNDILKTCTDDLSDLPNPEMDWDELLEDTVEGESTTTITAATKLMRSPTKAGKQLMRSATKKHQHPGVGSGSLGWSWLRRTSLTDSS